MVQTPVVQGSTVHPKEVKAKVLKSIKCAIFGIGKEVQLERTLKYMLSVEK